MIRLRTGRAALFGAMLAIALIAFLPMRLALAWFGLGEQGLTARQVTGSVWAGRLTEARFGDVSLGDLSAGLSPWPLAVGRARIDLAAPQLTGAVTVSRHALGVDDVTAAIPVGRAFAPLPIGAFDLTDLSVRFVDGACDRAEGRVRATLAGAVGPVALTQALAGTARCEGDALLLPLVSGAGEQATVRLWQDGRYRAELALPTLDIGATAALEGAGFVQVPTGWRLAIEGRF